MRTDPALWAAYDGPHPGVPSWLEPSLVEWVTDQLFHDYADSSEVPALSRWVRTPLPTTYGSFQKTLRTSADLLLNAVDFVLMRIQDVAALQELQRILDEAGSLYAVGIDEQDHFELQERIQPETMTFASEVMAGEGRFAEHLRLAWSKAFGRDKDPSAAYDHSIKAVETAARPIVAPTDARVTLGKMIAAMADKPSKWTTPIDCEQDISHVVAMMRLLWEGHYRHGDESKPLVNTPPSAAAGVQLAVVLSQWFTDGTVSRAES